MMVCCGMAEKRMGMLGVRVSRRKVLLWKWRQWHWLINVDRIWPASCRCMQWIVKYLILVDLYFWELCYVWINTFSLSRYVFWGCHFSLGSSCIWVMQFVFLPSTARPAQIFIGFNVFFVCGVSYSHTDMPFCVQSVFCQYGICFQRDSCQKFVSVAKEITGLWVETFRWQQQTDRTQFYYSAGFWQCCIFELMDFLDFRHMCWNIAH
jgi:hypothetical protein